MTTRILAYAKLNLALVVLGRRADEYHEIDSIAQTIDLADRLEFDVGPGDSVEVANSLADLQGPDLALRAATALLAAKGSRRAVRIRIRKAIPAGAGLGGGSSDAAAVLSTLDQLIEPHLPAEDLATIAAGIGSDVVLFLGGGRARMTGRGEVIQRLPGVSDEVYVVVVPPVRCPTADVYRAWVSHSAPRSTAEPTLGRNDLLGAALAVHPELAKVGEAVARSGALYGGMSGSGSSFYAAFRSLEQAHAAAERVRGALPDCRITVCRPTDVGSKDEEGDLYEDRN